MKKFFFGRASFFGGGSNTIVGSGRQASKIFILGPSINTLILNGSVDVEIKPGSNPQAELIGDDNLIDFILVQQEGYAVSIGMKENTSISTKNDMKVILYLPQSLSFITLKGSGDIISFNESCTKLELIELHGSGDIKIDCIKSNKLTVLLDGNGDVCLHKGSIDIASYTISGNGDILAKDVVCGIASAYIQGSGDIKLQVTSSLDASVFGSGDILYCGSPINVTKKESGDGDIKKMK